MIIKNCIITKQDSKIIRDWKVSNREIHSGIDILGNKVYAPFHGVVIDCLYNPKEKNVIIIQYSSTICTRLANLASVSVRRGSVVVVGDEIGTCDKFVHVEYLVSQKPNNIPPMSVRIENLSYYKINPIDFVLGKYKFPVIMG